MTKYEYKVAFPAEPFEDALNTFGAEGWLLISGGEPYDAMDGKRHMLAIFVRADLSRTCALLEPLPGAKP